MKNNDLPEMDKEANQFAMCLLMPENLIKEEIEKLKIQNGNSFDFIDSEVNIIKKMANIFQVSEFVMALRLSQLGYLNI